MKVKSTNSIQHGENRIIRLSLALALGVGLGAGSALGRAIINVGGVCVIGTVKLTDSAAADFLDVDFTADGPSGFTVASSGSLPGPGTYLSPV